MRKHPVPHTMLETTANEIHQYKSQTSLLMLIGQWVASGVSYVVFDSVVKD